jgi:CubicO group peptidase (beta-lactamase class C family)
VRIAALVLGLLLAHGAAAAGPLPLPAQPAGVPWPTAGWPQGEPGPGVDRAALEAASERAFSRVGPGGVPDTRALLAIHRGVLVHERYAPGFGPDTRFHSWSMAKSVTQALVGILVGDGRLDVAAPAKVPLWQQDGDPRRELTLDQLLHMTSGLDNADNRGGEGAGGFVGALIFGEGATDQARYAADVPLAHEPDTHWAYSTGTSTIVASLVQAEVGGNARAMRAFMARRLFRPLGIRGMLGEFDAAGTFMGGGFVWAPARDWARFGYLYLRDGVWEGRRLLPEGWVDYTRTRAPAPNNTVFGAHFWLNAEPYGEQFELLPGAPESAFCATGAYGQYVCMVPSHDLLVVRLGEMHASGWPEMREPLVDLIAAFPPLAPLAPATGATP